MRAAVHGMAIAIAFAVAFTMAPAAGRAASNGGDWETATPQALSVNPEPLARLAAALEHGDFPKTTSVLVVYRDKLVFEKYAAGGSRDLLNDTRSATKSITALAVGVAIADGHILSAREPAFGYFADLQPFANDDPLKRRITIEDLLTMSSALECDDDRDESAGNEDRMHEQDRWARWIVDLPVKTGYRRDSRGRGPFAYCTAGAVLLGQIVQRAVKTPVDEYVESRIFRPLGITRWEWLRSPTGEVMTGGGLRLRSRDLAKLAWMMTQEGRWRGQQVIPAAWIEATTTAATKANAQQDYGYLLWQRSFATGCGPVSGWYMAGNGGNHIVMLPALGAAIVVTRQNYNTRGMHQQTAELIDRYILQALSCVAP